MAISERAKQISVDLQELAGLISAFLEERAGEPLGFMLLISFDGAAQYVGTTDRAAATALLEELLERFKKPHHADIPAHYNPDLMP